MNVKNSLVLLFFFKWCFCAAQFYSPRFVSIDNNNSSEISLTSDIAVDKNYRYWITCFNNGLIEYDGNTFTPHHMPSSQNNVVGSDYLLGLLLDNDSIMWITHERGIAKFNIYRKTFELIPVQNLLTDRLLIFYKIFKDSRGNVFFPCAPLGLLYFDKQSNSVKPFKAIDENVTGQIYKITETTDNNYYLLYTTRGLFLYDFIQKKLPERSQYPPEYKWLCKKEFQYAINDFVQIDHLKFLSIQDSTGKDYSVIQYDEQKNLIKKLPMNAASGRLLYKDNSKLLWLYGLRSQPAVYDPVTETLYNLPDRENNGPKVDFSLCYKIIEDHENTIWLCTNSGLFTYNRSQNTYSVISKNLPGNIFSASTQVDASTFWFGTIYNGIYEYNAVTKQFKNYNFLKETGSEDCNDIWHIHTGADGKYVWVLHSSGKISRYDKSKKKFYYYDNSLFNNDEQLSIADNENGDVFVITRKGEIIRFDPVKNTFNPFFNLNKLKTINKNLDVTDMLALGNDALLIGTSGNGLIKFNLHDFSYKKFKLDAGKQNSNINISVNAIKKFDNKTAYATTNKGIFLFDLKTEKMEFFNHEDRFNLGYVYDITMDKDSNIIFTGTSKMFLLNWKTKDVIDLGQKSNIERSQFMDVNYSKSLDQLFAVTEESIYEIKLNSNNFAPEIKPIIYSIESYDKTFFVKNEGEIVLDPSYNSFQLSFGSSTHKFKDYVDYYYSFNNTDWIAAKSNHITFSKLPGGEYDFRLKVVYKGNKSHSSETFLTIRIKKKFHETIWFYLIIASAAMGIFYLFYRIRLNKALAVEKVRLQLSRDLHDDMGSTLSTINILSSIAGDKLDKDPESTRNYISRIASNSQQMMDSMDDIVWSINPANDSMKKVIYRMREFAWGILEPKKIDLVFDAKEEINHLKLNMASRRDFYLIYKEAINNAAKYSGCSKLKVQFSIENKHLVLQIKDNGKGFEVREYEDGNGLVNMKKRAAQIKAHFSVESQINEGTTIELRLDIQKL